MGVFKWLQRHLTNSTPWMDMFNTITVPQLRVEQFSVLPKFWLRSGKWRGGKNNDIGKGNNKDNILLKCKYMYLSQSVSQFSHSVVSDSLRPHELQHARPPCPSPTPRIHPNPCPLSQWCHPAISSSVVPFSSCPQSLPVSESFPMSQHFAWGGQSTGVSALASFLPKKSQGWSPSEWTG